MKNGMGRLNSDLAGGYCICFTLKIGLNLSLLPITSKIMV